MAETPMGGIELDFVIEKKYLILCTACKSIESSTHSPKCSLLVVTCYSNLIDLKIDSK